MAHHRRDEDLLICTILAGSPGCGKSTRMLDEIIMVPGRYVLAAPRIDLIEEHAERLRELAERSSPDVRPIVVVIHSRQSAKKVDRRLGETLADIEGRHVVVLTTHEGLMGLDRNDIQGWHIRIDELPETGISSDLIGLGASWRTLKDLYDLMPAAESGWWRLVAIPGVELPGPRQILADVGAKLLKPMRLAGSRGRHVEIDIGAWEDAGVADRRVHWRSIWSLASLRGCASLRVAAAGYASSIIGHATHRAGGVGIELVEVGGPRTGQPRIQVYWYTRHAGSTAWWTSHAGSACVAAIGRHLLRIDFRGYWMANAAAAPYLEHRFAGTKITPRSAGTNSLREHVACAAIYSSKATSADDAVIAALGLDRDAIRTAREDEDLYQCATRGAIRDPAYAGSYDIHVYDEQQAVRLEARLRAGGYRDVTLVPVPMAGIIDAVRPTARRAQPADAPVETAAERVERKRQAERERGQRRRDNERGVRIELGTHRGRGRPKGSINRQTG